MIFGVRNILLNKVAPVVFCMITAAILMVACSSDDPVEEVVPEEEEEIVVDQHDVTPDFTSGLTEIVMAYQDLYEAKLSTNPETRRNAVEQFRLKIADVEPKGLHSSAIREWNNLVDMMAEEAEALQNSEQQVARDAHFYGITDILTNALERYGGAEMTVYRFFCDQAFSGSGAAWLSTSHEIKNPYLRDAPMSCGEIETTL